MRRWFNTRARRTELESLRHRIGQLEAAIRRDGGRILRRDVTDHDTLSERAAVRDAGEHPLTAGREPLPDGRIVGWYDPVDPLVIAAQKELVERNVRLVPENVKRLLEKAELASWGDLPLVKASGVGWRDLLTPRRIVASDGAAISNTTSETIMTPDYTFDIDTFEVGDVFKFTLLFDHSTVITTPGTHTFRLRYGGVGGTAMATSGAFAPDPTAASTTLSEMLEYWLVCRSVGSAGSFMTMGRYTPNDFDDASATTLKGNLDMLMVPVSAPAAVGSLDTTAAKAISPTYQSSVNTATTQLTTHIALLESLN